MVTVAKNKKRETSSFGRRLRVLREAAGLTQEELAARVNIPYQSIARYERGEVEPTWPRVITFAEALGVEVGAFHDDTEGEDKPHTSKPPRKK